MRGNEEKIPKEGSLLRKKVKTKVLEQSEEEIAEEEARGIGRDEARNWENEDLLEERIHLFISGDLHYPSKRKEVAFLREKLGEKVLLLGSATRRMIAASENFSEESIYTGTELKKRYFQASLIYLREFLLAKWSLKEGGDILPGREHINLITEDETVAERLMLDVMRTVTEETLLHPPTDERTAKERDDLITGLNDLVALLEKR